MGLVTTDDTSWYQVNPNDDQWGLEHYDEYDIHINDDHVHRWFAFCRLDHGEDTSGEWTPKNWIVIG